MTTSVTAPSRFSLRVPPDWVQFDIQRATRTGELTRIVDEHLSGLPHLRPLRRDILRALRHLATEAESAGAVLCAAVVDDQGADGALLATLVAFITDGMPEPALNTIPAIAAQLTATPRTEPAADGTESDWREVRVIEIPAGDAVQLRGLTTIEVEADVPSLRLVTMETLIPLPGGERILNLVLTSPHVTLVDDLLEVFGLISETLTWDEVSLT